METIYRQMLELLKQMIEAEIENLSLPTMLASEDVLRREWDSDAEDESWADL